MHGMSLIKYFGEGKIELLLCKTESLYIHHDKRAKYMIVVINEANI